MNWHPIILSGPEVRAVLYGEKTQIRRAVNMRWIDYVGPKGCGDDPGCWGWADAAGEYHLLERGLPDRGEHSIPPPLGDKGDKLWVRETWRAWSYSWGCDEGNELLTVGSYVLDGGWNEFRADGDSDNLPWLSPIYMPRKASRISLEIVADVQVERVDGKWFWVYDVKKLEVPNA